MKCATTILSKEDMVLHEYTLTEADIKKACAKYAGVAPCCEVDIRVVNGELMVVVKHKRKRSSW